MYTIDMITIVPFDFMFEVSRAWYLMLVLWQRRIWALQRFTTLLSPEPDCSALTVKLLILNCFGFTYQISSSEEHGRYLMPKMVFIFAVHLLLSNFKLFLQLYRTILSFSSVIILLRLKIYILCGYSGNKK